MESVAVSQVIENWENLIFSPEFSRARDAHWMSMCDTESERSGKAESISIRRKYLRRHDPDSEREERSKWIHSVFFNSPLAAPKTNWPKIGIWDQLKHHDRVLDLNGASILAPFDQSEIRDSSAALGHQMLYFASKTLWPNRTFLTHHFFDDFKCEFSSMAVVTENKAYETAGNVFWFLDLGGIEIKSSGDIVIANPNDHFIVTNFRYE